MDCPHCKEGHPFKSFAGPNRYHIVPWEDGFTYKECSAWNATALSGDSIVNHREDDTTILPGLPRDSVR